MSNTTEPLVVRKDNAKPASWDGVDAQIDALKRLARTRVGGHECAVPCAEFADIVERLYAARKRELATHGNAAASAALSAPARNCDRFNSGEEAWIAFERERPNWCDEHSSKDPDCMDCEMADCGRCMAEWLFSTAEGGAK